MAMDPVTSLETRHLPNVAVRRQYQKPLQNFLGCFLGWVCVTDL
ncbi:hypothetical protein DSTSK_34530 [Desulforhabdus sp. TSK]|nr:hypothetical protein DSTSK_34530 [Desulforhabdus sp. TSK]